MNKPYRSFGDYVRERFGCKVYKVPVDAGFTCPNIDGTLAYGGCTYCNNDTFRPDYASRKKSLEEQIKNGKELFRQKNAEKFLVYFQSYTNTYAPVDRLEDLYSRALETDDVVGLCIGTRPDCISGDVVELLNQYVREGYEIWVELGLQSSNDRTLERINRKHDFEAYRRAVRLIRECPEINICSHLMFGLPGETVDGMKQTVLDALDVGFEGVKFHQTQVVYWTELAEDYWNDRYEPIDYSTYRDLITWSLNRMPDDVVVQRVYGETTDNYLIAPRWDVPKSQFMNEVDLQYRDTSTDTSSV